MPGPTLQTDALVLLKQPPADAFQTFTVFPPSTAGSLCSSACRKNAPASVALDLFDDVALLLESSNQGRTWFVRESRLVTRHGGIGRHYESLRFASTLATLVARNAVPDESRAPVAALLRTAFAAFAESARPDPRLFQKPVPFGPRRRLPGETGMAGRPARRPAR